MVGCGVNLYLLIAPLPSQVIHPTLSKTHMSLVSAFIPVPQFVTSSAQEPVGYFVGYGVGRGVGLGVGLGVGAVVGASVGAAIAHEPGPTSVV